MFFILQLVLHVLPKSNPTTKNSNPSQEHKPSNQELRPRSQDHKRKQEEIIKLNTNRKFKQKKKLT